MAQYVEYLEGEYTTYANPSTDLKIREGQRDHKWVIDKQITALGFSGVEDTDWARIGGDDSAVVITGGKIRLGVGSGATYAGYYVVEKELIVGGFLLDLGNGEGEGVGWEMIFGAT